MMTIYQYGSKISNVHKGQIKFFIRTQALAWTVIIIFMHILCNPYFEIGLIDPVMGYTKMIVYGLASACIIFSVVMIFYTNELFLNQNQRVLGIMSISGLNFTQLVSYLSLQNLKLQMKSIPMCILISILLLPSLNIFSNTWLSEFANIFTFNGKAYFDSFIIYILLWVFMLLENVGFIYRIDIKQLISREKAKDKIVVEMPLKKTAGIVFIIFFVFTTLYFPPVSFYNVMKYAVLGMIGIALVITNIITPFIRRIQKKRHLRKYDTIIYGQLYHIISSNALLTKLLCLVCGIMTILFCYYHDDTEKLMVVFMSFIVILFMVTICLVHHISTYMLQHKKQYTSLLALGYATKDILYITKKECFLFFCILYLLAYFVSGIVTTQMLRYDLIQITTYLFIIFIHLLFIGISYFLGRNAFKKAMEESI